MDWGGWKKQKLSFVTPGLRICLYCVFLGLLGGLFFVFKWKNFKAGELFWVVHTVILGRQSLLGIESSRVIFSSAVLSVWWESYSKKKKKKLFHFWTTDLNSDPQSINMLMCWWLKLLPINKNCHCLKRFPSPPPNVLIWYNLFTDVTRSSL